MTSRIRCPTEDRRRGRDLSLSRSAPRRSHRCRRPRGSPSGSAAIVGGMATRLAAGPTAAHSTRARDARTARPAGRPPADRRPDRGTNADRLRPDQHPGRAADRRGGGHRRDRPVASDPRRVVADPDAAAARRGGGGGVRGVVAGLPRTATPRHGRQPTPSPGCRTAATSTSSAGSWPGAGAPATPGRADDRRRPVQGPQRPYGHAQGDEVLRAVGAAIVGGRRARTRPAGTAARSSSSCCAPSLDDALESASGFGRRLARLTSAGWASAGHGVGGRGRRARRRRADRRSRRRGADRALYRAKRAGRDRVEATA